MRANDLDTVARLHADAFPGFFLTTLGIAALRELYRSMLDDASGIAIVADSGGRVSGFASGTTQPRSYYRRLLFRRWWRVTLALAPPLLRRPSIVWQLAWRMRLATKATPAGDVVLLSVAVAPAEQGRGLGRALVSAFIAEARRRAAQRLSLTTDATANERVERFYHSLGFVHHRAYSTPEKRLMHEYVIDL